MNNGSINSELNSLQKKKAKKLAHHLEPVVYIGRQGLTESVIAKADECLLSHELIKIKFIDHKDRKQVLTKSLAETTGSLVVGLIGHVAVLYRPHPEMTLRKIIL
jgi:RNA-binding protein